MISVNACVQVSMNEQDMEIYDWMVNTPALYLRDFGFDSLPGDRTSSDQIPEVYPKIGYDRLGLI
jgi:hypothetical protein